MGLDQTQHQSGDELSKSEELSRKRTTPPAEVPGYLLQEFLGSGAYGEVWVGVDQNSGRRIAIKFYTRRSRVDFSLLSREVQKLAQLAADRYVVQLLDVGWDADPPYYVMDYIENGSLEDHLKQRGAYPVSEALDLFQEVAIGLSHMHSKGILHCDLKPGNVLLDTDLKPRLADFGQSRLSHEQSPALGTLFYMAPEQADLEAIPDARWDVFALGALFYSMLTGSPPYRDDEVIKQIEKADGLEDRLERYRKAISAAPAPNDHRNIPGVDKQLADIITRCLTVNPDRRFQSVQGVLLELRQREESLARRPLVLLGLLGPLVLFLVMGAFGWGLYDRAINNTKRSLSEKARESNNWAAQFAARSAGAQIDSYFRSVERLANDPAFLKKYTELISDGEFDPIRTQLVDPNRNLDPQLDGMRKEFRENELRTQLELRLRQAMEDPASPNSASWFITDANGTQIAFCAEQPSKTPTVGRNYAYRTYFHGGNRDLVDKASESKKYLVKPNPNSRDYIQQSHLSAIFISQATNTWKVAFSTPIYIDGKFAGIIAATVELGGFVEFENDSDHYAMLVDFREGENQGVILEHPLFDSLREAGKIDFPTLQRFNTRRIALESITDKGFEDPIGKDELGRDYQGVSIVSTSEVMQRKGGTLEPLDDGQMNQNVGTGLVVMTLEDSDSIFAPVRSLGRQLFWLAFAALVMVTVVATALAWLVIRSLRESRDRVQRAFRSASTETTTGSL